MHFVYFTFLSLTITSTSFSTKIFLIAVLLSRFMQTYLIKMCSSGSKLLFIYNIIV